jgi:hypothetical protein
MEYIVQIMKNVKTRSYIGMKGLESCYKPILGLMTNDNDDYYMKRI